jgi:hypothetical protein
LLWLLEAIRTLASLGSVLRLDAGQCGSFVVRFGQSVILVQRIESAKGVLIAVIGGQLVPLSSF